MGSLHPLKVHCITIITTTWLHGPLLLLLLQILTNVMGITVIAVIFASTHLEAFNVVVGMDTS